MGVGNVLKNSWKYLPAGSYINSALEEARTGIKSSTLKDIGHVAYATIGTVLATLYTFTGFGTNEWNPINQHRVLSQKKAEIKQKREAEETRYNELMNQMFLCEHPLADSDGDGLVDINERVDAFCRMGLEGEVSFPNPSVRDLEVGVKSYQSDNK